MKSTNFIPGEWYYCGCNEMYYRFKQCINTDRLAFDAVINPTNRKIVSSEPGLNIQIVKGLIDHFSSTRIVPSDVINKYIKQKDYEIY